MAIDLRNPAGDTCRISGGHWAVYLTLAECFGWKPARTRRPPGLPPEQPWSGEYASSDGQIVEEADAKLLAQVLHAAAVSPDLYRALTDIIGNIEADCARDGLKIPPGMRMKPDDFREEFSPLLVFLYKGSFSIH